MKKARVFIGCERYGRIRDAFLRLGIPAISCDLEETLSPGPHIKGNVLEIAANEEWDLFICHPPCKYLAFSGEQWIKNNPERQELREKAFAFFKATFKIPAKRRMIENSFSTFINKNFRKPDFSLQPWQFGEQFQKRTDFWTENLPIILPEDIVSPGEFHVTPSGKRIPKWYGNNKGLRDVTFKGIAEGIARQYAKILHTNRLPGEYRRA